MKRQLVATCALLLVLASSPSWAANGDIGLFFDPGAALCQQTIPIGTSATLYVYALLEGATAGGITGAEYKIMQGLSNAADPGWFFMETFDPTATTIGSGAMGPADPLARGINVAWPSCQTGDGTKVLIETVDMFNAGTTAELRLLVVKHDTPSNQYFQCPLFTGCDEAYTKYCLGHNLATCKNPEPPYGNTSTCSTSGMAYANPIPGRDCRVATRQTTWSTVKDLYR